MARKDVDFAALTHAEADELYRSRNLDIGGYHSMSIADKRAALEQAAGAQDANRTTSTNPAPRSVNQGLKEDARETKAAKAEDQAPSNSSATMGETVPADPALSDRTDSPTAEPGAELDPLSHKDEEGRSAVGSPRKVAAGIDPGKIPVFNPHLTGPTAPDRDEEIRLRREGQRRTRQGEATGAVNRPGPSSTRGPGWNVLEEGDQVRLLVTNGDYMTDRGNARAFARRVLAVAGKE